MKNYLTLTFDEKNLLILSLREAREALKKDAKLNKIKKKRKSKKKKITFDNPELNKIFNDVPELQDYLRGKG